MTVRTILRAAFLALLVVAASATGADKAGRDGKGKGSAKGTQVGLASYYGPGLHGRKTASGEVFNKAAMVAAHPFYPLGSLARVTNLRNGQSEEVRIIDRGPIAMHQRRGVIIDVSEGVAKKLGFRKRGKTRVEVQVLEWGEKNGK